MVKLIHNDYVEVEEFTEDKVIFTYKNETYQIKRAHWMEKTNGYLIKKRT